MEYAKQMLTSKQLGVKDNLSSKLQRLFNTTPLEAPKTPTILTAPHDSKPAIFLQCIFSQDSYNI